MSLATRRLAKFNANHLPAGSPDGGEFAAGSGGPDNIGKPSIETAQAVLASRMLDAAKNGGFTFHPTTGETPTSGYSVGAFPHLTKTFDAEKITVDDIKGFLASNAAILKQKGVMIGGWLDEGKIWLDPVRVLPNSAKDRAISLGKRKNQIAIADLGAIHRGDWDHAFIPTGGTGDAPTAKASTERKTRPQFFLWRPDTDPQKMHDALLAVTKYSAGEPRDYRGRWTSSGSNPMTQVSEAHGKTLGQALTIARAMPDTSQINTPARTALREHIVQQLASQLRQVPAERKLDYMIGVPGAGKSTLVKQIQHEHQAFNLDQDEIKTMLPEYANGLGAMAVHNEAAMIAGKVMGLGVREGRNMIIQGTGKTYANLEPLLHQLKSVGYKINVHLVTLPTSLAMERAHSRFLHTGRVTPPEFIRNVDHIPNRNFAQLIQKKGLVDGYASYDSNVPKGGSPRVLRSRLAKSRGAGSGVRASTLDRRRTAAATDRGDVCASCAYTSGVTRRRATRLSKSDMGPGDVHVSTPIKSGRPKLWRKYSTMKPIGAVDAPGNMVAGRPRGRLYKIGPILAPVIESLKSSAEFYPHIVKGAEEQRLVVGWCSVITEPDGSEHFDLQDDAIEEHELVTAMQKFWDKSRRAGDMHRRTDGIGEYLEYFVLTKQAKLDLGVPDSVPTGCLVAVRVHDDSVWQKVKDGTYQGFSIGGTARHVLVP